MQLIKDNKITFWPSPKQVELRTELFDFLINKFEIGKTYSEKEVNEIIKNHSLIEDVPLLRRELYERELLDRDKEGKEYKRVDKTIE